MYTQTSTHTRTCPPTRLLQRHPQVEVRVGQAALVERQAGAVALDGLADVPERLFGGGGCCCMVFVVGVMLLCDCCCCCCCHFLWVVFVFGG